MRLAITNYLGLGAAIAWVLSASLSVPAYARDLEYAGSEVEVRVLPGEPTQMQFPGSISGGYKKKLSAISIDRKGSDLIIFANEGISEAGESLIVRLDDGRSYSIRTKRASQEHPRDDIVRLNDQHGAMIAASDEEEPQTKDRQFQYAPPNQVSGLMREMMLMAEFGKTSVAGYRVSETYRGETVLNDGTMVAKIDKILIGPNLWGYVIETQNMLDQTQRLNPASFRIDGTRAVAADRWELAPRPLNVEEQISGKDKARIYVVTRAKQ
ncbi:MAG: type-F conjugative transfer system secretin TraK [Oligoflexia bacterium]|nr:type-F conjugative transfer system secretin TraK [Oligoflexia bacterium]